MDTTDILKTKVENLNMLINALANKKQAEYFISWYINPINLMINNKYPLDLIKDRISKIESMLIRG